MAIAELSRTASNDSRTHARKKKTRNPLVRFLLMVIRRSHLYFGLLLVPWAILYGVTAYLFNHPSHFSTTKQESVSATAIPANWPTRNWNAKELAQSVVEQLNARFETANTAVDLDEKVAAKFEGNNITCTYEHDGRSYSVLIAVDGKRGTLRSQPIRVEVPAPKTAFFEVVPPGATGRTRGRSGPQDGISSPRERSTETTQRQVPGVANSAVEVANLSRTPIFVVENVSANLKASVVEIAKNHGHEIELDAVRIASIPDLAFIVSTNDEKWECRYSALTGAVNTKPSSTPGKTEFSWRRFLLRLHTAHTYPDEFNARWFWAIVVDIMAFVMVFWGVSGIVMWWQIKATRPTGSVAMAISLISAIALGWAMFLAI